VVLMPILNILSELDTRPSQQVVIFASLMGSNILY
jgi:hypothetical protein